LILRVHIHENADAEAAQQYWLDVTHTRPDQFRRPTLKRHNPKTLRTNVGENYHGCLRIDVRRSVQLYRRIEGWASAAMVSNLRTQARVRTRTHFLLPGEDSNLRIRDQNPTPCLTRRPGIGSSTNSTRSRPPGGETADAAGNAHTPLPAGQEAVGHQWGADRLGDS
jgi:hypothetical protein